jgi:hypothetical protein
LVNANTTTISEAALIKNTNGSNNISTQLGYVGISGESVKILTAFFNIYDDLIR